jgi:hypothetical protein
MVSPHLVFGHGRGFWADTVSAAPVAKIKVPAIIIKTNLIKTNFLISFSFHLWQIYAVPNEDKKAWEKYASFEPGYFSDKIHFRFHFIFLFTTALYGSRDNKNSGAFA